MIPMKLSTRGRYGLRLMLDLALHSGREPVTLKAMSERQDISEKYLWHIILPLVRAGLVSSIRGSLGGYRLAKPPQTITVLEIYRAVEGPLFLVDCISNGHNCARADLCATRDLWSELGDLLEKKMDSITLEELVERHKKKIRCPAKSDNRSQGVSKNAATRRK
jgi:Rrf2 family protein